MYKQKKNTIQKIPKIQTKNEKKQNKAKQNKNKIKKSKQKKQKQKQNETPKTYITPNDRHLSYWTHVKANYLDIIEIMIGHVYLLDN